MHCFRTGVEKGMKLCTAVQEGCGYKDTLRVHRYFAPLAKYFTVCITYQPAYVLSLIHPSIPHTGVLSVTLSSPELCIHTSCHMLHKLIHSIFVFIILKEPTLSGHTLLLVTEVHYLGLILDKEMTWKAQLKN